MLEKIVIVTLIVWSVYCVFWSGMILGSVSRWISYRTPQWVQKIIFGCVCCMSFYYGTLAYWLIWRDSWEEWLVVIFSSIGLNAIIVNFTPKDPNDEAVG